MTGRVRPVNQCEVISGEWRFTSSAFDNATPLEAEEHPDDMSVVLGDTLAALSHQPEALPQRRPESDLRGVAVLTAGYLTDEEGQELRRTPDLENDEPAHGDVRGKKGPGRRKRIKRNAVWLVPPAARTDDAA